MIELCLAALFAITTIIQTVRLWMVQADLGHKQTDIRRIRTNNGTYAMRISIKHSKIKNTLAKIIESLEDDEC